MMADHSPRDSSRGEDQADAQTLKILAAIEPHESAQLLGRLERGHQSAYRASRTASRTSAGAGQRRCPRSWTS